MSENVTASEKPESTTKAAQPRRAAAIAGLLSGRSQGAIAKELGISEKQLSRWLARPDFQVALKKAEAEVLDQAVRRLVGVIDPAITVLMGIALDSKHAAGVRVRAAGLLLEQAVRLREYANLEQRIANLEGTLSNGS